MGDRTQSQFLRHLRGLAGNVFSVDALRSLWLSRLPGSMQAILATQRDLTLEKLGELADAINDTNFRKHVSEASMTEPMSAMFQQLTLLTAKIAELSTSLHSGSENHNNRSRHRNRSQSRNRQRSRVRSEARDGICWYHTNFGQNARKCTPPCSKSTGN